MSSKKQCEELEHEAMIEYIIYEFGFEKKETVSVLRECNFKIDTAIDGLIKMLSEDSNTAISKDEIEMKESSSSSSTKRKYEKIEIDEAEASWIAIKNLREHATAHSVFMECVNLSEDVRSVFIPPKRCALVKVNSNAKDKVIEILRREEKVVIDIGRDNRSDVLETPGKKQKISRSDNDTPPASRTMERVTSMIASLEILVRDKNNDIVDKWRNWMVWRLKVLSSAVNMNDYRYMKRVVAGLAPIFQKIDYGKLLRTEEGYGGRDVKHIYASLVKEIHKYADEMKDFSKRGRTVQISAEQKPFFSPVKEKNKPIEIGSPGDEEKLNTSEENDIAMQRSKAINIFMDNLGEKSIPVGNARKAIKYFSPKLFGGGRGGDNARVRYLTPKNNLALPDGSFVGSEEYDSCVVHNRRCLYGDRCLEPANPHLKKWN